MRWHTDHLPVHYRPGGADRCETPADVCGTCSDLEGGLLVPVSFCPEAARKNAEEYDRMVGGPEPDWMWQRGTDATSAVLA